VRYTRAVLSMLSPQEESDIAECCPKGCTTWSVGSHRIVSLPSEVDMANLDLVRRALLEACTGDSVVVADMAVTTFLGADGIGVLASIGKQLHDAGGELRLVARRAHILRVLSVLKIDKAFRIFANVSDALADARPNPLSCDLAA
jgi:anti-anti-sigma factor